MLCRSVGGREFSDADDHLVGALLRHLSPASLPTLADRRALLPDVGRRLGMRVRRHGSGRRQPAIPTAR